MKIAQVIPRIAAASSGTSEATPRLCKSLDACGVDVTLYTLKPKPKIELFHKARYFDCLRLPGAYRLGSSPAMKQALNVFAKEGDVIHTNSLWMMPNIYPASAIKGTSCKLVISPHGTVSDWALKRSRFKKWCVSRLGQRAALERAHCLHATSETECEELRRLGLRQPVAVISNGVEVPDRLSRESCGESRDVLFLSRIHPKKGVDLLLDCWSSLEAKFPDWSLRIAGPIDNRYAQQMIAKSEALRLQRVEFVGEVVGREKEEEFRRANLFVLPTHSENFGICVAESLAAEVPAIVFHGAPWSGLNTHNAGWWIEPGLNSLKNGLSEAMSVSEERRSEMGSLGREWMMKEFEWSAIGRRHCEVYRWLIGGGQPPPEIRTY